MWVPLRVFEGWEMFGEGAGTVHNVPAGVFFCFFFFWGGGGYPQNPWIFSELALFKRGLKSD